jgi:hypothetical protein
MYVPGPVVARTSVERAANHPGAAGRVITFATVEGAAWPVPVNAVVAGSAVEHAAVATQAAGEVVVGTAVEHAAEHGHSTVSSPGPPSNVPL